MDEPSADNPTDERSASNIPVPDARARAAQVVAQLHVEGDPNVRQELASRYGIHVDRAVGIPMRRMKAIARPLFPDPSLAEALWSTGLYEARTVAVFTADPTQVGGNQMDRWAADFDNWAIVDTACFHLFDRTAAAWTKVDQWTGDERTFVKRAGFALLWALALHDKNATDELFRTRLPRIEAEASDPRPLVGKAVTMALRAIATKRPGLRAEVVELAQRLATSPHREAKRVGRPIVRAFS